MRQVEQILLGARQQGIDCEALLTRAEISPELLRAPLARVSVPQFAALITQLRRATRDEFWGLCNRALPLGSFEQTCRVMMGFPTLGAALRAGLRHFRLLQDDLVPRLLIEDGLARMALSLRTPLTPALCYAVRVFAFQSYGLASWLVAKRLPLLAVDLPSGDDGRIAETATLFEAPVRREGASGGWTIGAHWLQTPVAQTHETLDSMLRRAPACLIRKYRDDSRISERVRRAIRAELDGQMPTLVTVAAQLAMTPQTLSRHLAREGHGFRTLRDQLLRDAAIGYLTQPQLTLPQIASALGFSEPSTFHRAFKSWTGVAPGVYRKTRQD